MKAGVSRAEEILPCSFFAVDCKTLLTKKNFFLHLQKKVPLCCVLAIEQKEQKVIKYRIRKEFFTGLRDEADFLGLDEINVRVKIEYHVERGYAQALMYPHQPNVVEVDRYEILDGLDHLNTKERQKVFDWVENVIWHQAKMEIYQTDWNN